MKNNTEIKISSVPPCDIDTECRLLGTMLLPDTNQKTIRKVLDIFNGNEKSVFYNAKNQIIFNVIVSMFNNDIPIDDMSVCLEIDKQGLTDKIDNRNYVFELFDSCPGESLAEYYAESLIELSQRRDLIQSLYKLSEQAKNSAIDVGVITENIELLINRIHPTIKREKLIESAKDFLQREKTQTPYIIDQLLPASGFTTIAGYTGQGKSTLATQMILSILQGSTFLNKLKVSDENYHILYLNLENSEYTLDRLLKCQLSEYELNETQLERLFIPDCMAMTFDNRKDVATINRWIEELHIEIVVIDPVLDSFTGDQNDLTIVKSVIRKMREINSKISWVMIHHFKKGNDEDSLINLMLGSVGFANASTSIIGLRRYSKSVNPMYKKIEFGKTRDFEQPDEIKVALNPITRIFEVVGDIDKFQPMTDDCVLDAFEENEKLTHTILVTRVEMSMGISEKQARILITKALATHKIKAENGFYSLTSNLIPSYLEMTKAKTSH